jgi:hypothetical protein
MKHGKKSCLRAAAHKQVFFSINLPPRKRWRSGVKAASCLPYASQIRHGNDPSLPSPRPYDAKC